MRIIRGKNKGKKIHAPKNLPVRPTTDFAKEGIFNILENEFDFEKLNVLDLFSGTGNITYEFASRGAMSITAVDMNENCTKFIIDTCTSLHFNDVTVMRRDVQRFVKKESGPYDLIYADPPYQMKGIQKMVDNILENNLIAENGWFILEHSERLKLDPNDRIILTRAYGNVNYTVYK